MSEWTKAIPEDRDRFQSGVLVWVVGTLLLISAFFLLLASVATRHHHSEVMAFKALSVSLTFAAVVWALKAATPMAAVFGGAICFLITLWTERLGHSAIYSGLPPLLALFVLTFAATRAGKTRKKELEVAEGIRGRNSAQVIANLGIAALVAPLVPVGLLSALCEATADTVSSEMGQAFGGRPFLLTTLRRVEPGTDGAISWLGTVAGVGAAGIVAGVGMWAMRMRLADAISALVAGIGGLVFDSLLGATVERKGWLGNDLVNFSSTVFAVAVALALMTRF